MQHMDYDGFRQMVLGANLRPMKAGQVERMYEGMNNTECNINHISTLNNIMNVSEYKGYNEEIVRLTLELAGTDQLKPPETIGEFEKFFCKKCKDPFAKYMYLRLIDFSQFEELFVTEFDAEVFVMVVATITAQVMENEAFNNEEEQLFVAKFMTIIAKTPKFDFIMDFMDDAERDKIKAIIKGLNKI